jgi:hypothetical protein
MEVNELMSLILIIACIYLSGPFDRFAACCTILVQPAQPKLVLLLLAVDCVPAAAAWG